MACPACGASTRARQRYCGTCSALLDYGGTAAPADAVAGPARVCSGCQGLSPEDARYCNACGRYLAPVPAPPPGRPPAPVPAPAAPSAPAPAPEAPAVAHPPDTYVVYVRVAHHGGQVPAPPDVQLRYDDAFVRSEGRLVVPAGTRPDPARLMSVHPGFRLDPAAVDVDVAQRRIAVVLAPLEPAAAPPVAPPAPPPTFAPPQPRTGPFVPLPRRQPPANVVVLAIVTLGIYMLPWLLRVTREIDRFLGPTRPVAPTYRGGIGISVSGLVVLVVGAVAEAEPLIGLGALAVVAGAVVTYVALWRVWTTVALAETRAGFPDPMSPGLMLVLTLVPYVNLVGTFVMMAQTQRRLNRLWG